MFLSSAWTDFWQPEAGGGNEGGGEASKRRRERSVLNPYLLRFFLLF